ncbi:MAG: hypothetical protein WCI89_01565 [bacterium]
MAEVVHADIFFFITSVAVVLLTAGVLVALYFFIGILRDVRAVAAKVRKASDELERDFERLRGEVKAEGMRMKTVFDVFLGFLQRHMTRTASAVASKRRKKSPESD